VHVRENNMAGKLIIKNLAELDESQVRQAVEIFAASFYELLSFISPEIEVIADTLEHSFLLEHYYAGLLDDNVVGIVACSTHTERAHRFNRVQLIKKSGLIKGNLAYVRLRKHFENLKGLRPHQCCIEWVATDSAYRGKGVSRKMQQYLLEELPYEEYVLEVANTNYSAIRLYEKLGFVVYERKTQKNNKRQSEFNEIVYMKKLAPKSQIAK
jgi:ribosomal protein S18 acetylase RimI-like enzyme